MIAALYVIKDGPYFGIPGIDPWDKSRDARRYTGPYPVIAHPPCERWGRYWSGGPSCKVRRTLGDDDGCFAAALDAVRSFGGVLEHPEASHAFKRFGLPIPDFSGGWTEADPCGGASCCVAQGHFGHAAQKMTWLYVVRAELPDLPWGRAPGRQRMDLGYHSAEERRRRPRTETCKRLSERDRATTPPPFRDALIRIAESVR